jgi:hypothetical protein
MTSKTTNKFSPEGRELADTMVHGIQMSSRDFVGVLTRPVRLSASDEARLDVAFKHFFGLNAFSDETSNTIKAKCLEVTPMKRVVASRTESREDSSH